MERSALVKLLAQAGQMLAETEASIRRELGAMIDMIDDVERSETKRQIEALQQQRLEHALNVQRLQDELDALSDGGGT
jgi:hypothetical protein